MISMTYACITVDRWTWGMRCGSHFQSLLNVQYEQNKLVVLNWMNDVLVSTLSYAYENN